jgi:UDP-N-acetylmuramoyl-L-alanyl-D-glutamate--2,6-diaminopimelate ligase
MTLEDVLAGAGLRAALSGQAAGLCVSGLAYDSRRVEPGFVFFAFPGSRADGREFAREAAQRGALAVLSESPEPEGFPGLWIEVEHGRRALAAAARNFHGRPDERLMLTGITGTNGKTTTSYLADAVLRAAGHTTGLFGTIEHRVAAHAIEAANTTPESLDLMQYFAQLERAGGDHVVMEVSSHALALGRVHGLRFHTVVFTNLTRDHLDYHGGMEEYFAAKQALFEGAGGPPPCCAVLNRDDPYAARLRIDPATRVYSYGRGAGADIRARRIAGGFRGLRLEVAYGRGRIGVASALVGGFNVYNILAACAVGLSYGVEPETIARGIAKCRGVPGRFERVDEGQPFLVVVDYAHTDDALRNVIGAARSLKPRRVITLFGCGGDRDRAKRPLMGQAAAEASDLVVLTSDNPRSEDPLAIMNDALVGIRRHTTPHIVEPDRAAAIARALGEAREGDLVILAGKGHETYQVTRAGKAPFDDREVARSVLHGFGYHRPGEP